MSYTTVYESAARSEIAIIRNLFDQDEIDFRVFDESTNDTFPLGVRIQVADEDLEKAMNILKENGFLGEPEETAQPVTKTRFWTYLFLALFVVVIVAVLINWFMNP